MSSLDDRENERERENVYILNEITGLGAILFWPKYIRNAFQSVKKKNLNVKDWLDKLGSFIIIIFF